MRSSYFPKIQSMQELRAAEKKIRRNVSTHGADVCSRECQGAMSQKLASKYQDLKKSSYTLYKTPLKVWNVSHKYDTQSIKHYRSILGSYENIWS